MQRQNQKSSRLNQAIQRQVSTQFTSEHRRRDGLRGRRVGARGAILAGTVMAVTGMLPVAADAACEQYPRFTPTSGRTSNEAWEADQFVNSIGVNLHLGTGRYASEFDRMVKSRLIESGIRVARTGIGSVMHQPEQIRALAQAGIRFTIVTGRQAEVDKAVEAIKKVGSQHILAIEGYNEPESRFGCAMTSSCWVQPTRDFQQRLFKAIKADPATKGIMVLGPALKGVALDFAPRMLGSIDSIMEAHNMHRYPGPNNIPETGPNYYLSKLIAHQRYVGNPSKPAFLTETGYSSNAGGTTEYNDGILTPRLFLWNFNHGVALTAKYQLLDLAAVSGNSDFPGNYGYIRSNNTPKPSFYAVKNLISLLSDRGPRFAPATLAYVLSGNTANVRKVLMQKRDGSFYLALWVAQYGQSVLPHAVTLAVPSTIDGAAAVRPNEGAAWRGLGIFGGRVNLILDEKVTIVRLTGGPRREAC